MKFPFGLGTNISYALERYKKGVLALNCGGAGIKDNGNGALMRMFPFSMYCILKDYSDEETLDVIRNAAAITHRHEINMMSCYMYTLFLRECIRTGKPSTAYEKTVYKTKPFYRDLFPDEAVDAHALLLNIDFRSTFNYNWIPENGYVVTSLAVLIYSILSTDNYEDAVKTAVSFGYDTDTNAAITGSVAGVIYGTENIPERWICHLKKRDYVKGIAEDFYRVVLE